MTRATEGQDGFEQAFDDLFPRAFKLARRLVGDTDVAEDIAAEALARAYANWPRVAGLEYRDGWVLRVAANLAVDRVRRHPDVIAIPVEAAGPNADDLVVLRVALVAALGSLPRRQRQAVALRYLGDLSDGEVAVALGISVGSVKTHIHRGLGALRRRLGPGMEEVVPVGLES
ncbi:MAG TPA: sigma-70 family RNA polymerase sigma factor [Acidimicrobiales bacterium]